MHILIISRSYPNRINYSSGNFVRNQVEALAKHNLKIGVVGVYNISLKEIKKPANIKKFGFYKEKDENVSLYSHLYPVLPKMHYLNYRIKFQIWKELFEKYINENGKPDLIHVHTFEAGEIAIWAKEKYNIPYIVTEHTTLFFTNKALKWHYTLASKVYANSKLNLAVSEASSLDLKQRFDIDFKYFPNFVDTSLFTLKKLNISKKKQFLNIAFLDPKKNQKMLIQAFDKAFKNNPDYQLKIIGSGPEKDKLLHLINKLNNDNIELLGYLPQKEIVSQLQSSDYFVLSSNYETFGVVLIEAMSCGLPVLSTRCGGPESIIVNDKLGSLSKTGDAVSFADNLIKLTNSTFDSKYIRDYANNNFSYEVLSEKLIQLYNSIV